MINSIYVHFYNKSIDIGHNDSKKLSEKDLSTLHRSIRKLIIKYNKKLTINPTNKE